MTVHQISIFVENKSGTLLHVLDLFKESGIQLIASTISDTVEYGIYRVICSEPKRAYEVLKAAGISASVSEVFAITLDNSPGRAADAVRFITGAGIGISFPDYRAGEKGSIQGKAAAMSSGRELRPPSPSTHSRSFSAGTRPQSERMRFASVSMAFALTRAFILW